MCVTNNNIRLYHQRTKHSSYRFAAGPGYLDWDNQPDPFRRFDGASQFDLPLCFNQPTESFGDLGQVPARPFDVEGLGQFLELALGLSAWKSFNGSRWALRNNPSSGNLHPTEGWIALRPLFGEHAGAALYHYSPALHALEERCAWAPPTGLPSGAFLFALSSVPWREAWKYGERAFRYCLLDAGHALAAASYAAATLGWRVRTLATVGDFQLTELLGLSRADSHHPDEPEHPELAALVWTDPASETEDGAANNLFVDHADKKWSGRANLLSPDHVDWSLVELAQSLSAKPITAKPSAPYNSSQIIPAPDLDAATVIRSRRSAQRMNSEVSMPLSAFFRMLGQTLYDFSRVPWCSFPWPQRLSLFLFVHRVEGLPPGLYSLVRDLEAMPRLRRACDSRFSWEGVPDCPVPLFLLSRSPMSSRAASLSCGQDIAGDGAFSLAMVADFDRTLNEDGDWSYRRLFWEAGIIGQILYLEATAAGLSGTGIGCYFDDEVHAALGFDGGSLAWQSLYHFTVGRPIDDPRLSTEPPYRDLRRA